MIATENAPWWNAHERKEDPAGRLIPLVRSIQDRQATRYQTMRRHVAVYEYGSLATDGLTSTSMPVVDDTRLFFNAAQNTVDTVVSQVATPRVVPMALTEGATYAAREKAKDMTQCFEGQWDECEIDALKEQVITDACMYEGVGLVKAYPSSNYDAIVFDRVCPLDVYVDNAEGRAGKPRSMFLRQAVDRYVLAEDYGRPDRDLHGSAAQRREAILKAPAARTEDDVESSVDTVEVWEAWHLPSRMPDPSVEGDKGSCDGRHVICVDGCTLVDEPWTEARFPFAVFRPKKSRLGWWGIPLMRQLAPGQREFERVTQKLQRAHNRMGGSHFVVGRNSKLEKRQMTADSGDIWDVDDVNQVKDVQPTPANPQTYEYQRSIVDFMMRMSGTSQLSAQGAVPAGLSQASGKALQVFSDETSKFYVLWHREVERWTLDVTDLMKMVVRHILEVNPAFSSKYREKRGYRVIRWKDVINEDHVVRVFPVSMLAQTPSAKFAQLSELLNAGAITVEQFRRLFELPDLAAENDIDCADYQVIDKSLDHMVMTGKYLMPQPFDNLELCFARGGKFYNACRVAEVPEERLELIRRFTIDAKAMLDERAEKERIAQQEAAAMAPPMMQQPPGVPMVPPVAA